jgi:hypothetical protein
MKLRCLAFGLLVASCLNGVAYAQVVREEGVNSIAGVVGNGIGYVEWTFDSAGGEVLFASLDAFIYQKWRGGDGWHDTTGTEGGSEAGAEGEGCGGEEGGPSRLCIQVIDAYNQVVCHATRPMPPPGWQRDPRLACLLPEVLSEPAKYRLRVVQVSMGEGGETGVSCKDVSDGLTSGDVYPFLLNVSLRRLAPSGVNIQAAIAQSKSRF